MQKSMLYNASLSIGCYCRVIRFPNPKISEINGEVYIWDRDLNFDIEIDAFNHPEIIPELIQLVNKIENGGNKHKLIIQWVKKWGVLQKEFINGDSHSQTLKDFWSDAKTFQIAWDLYKKVCERNSNTLEITYEVLEEIVQVNRYSKKTLETAQYTAIEFIMMMIQTYTRKGFMEAYYIKNDRGIDIDDIKVKPAFAFENLIDALFMQFLIAITESKKICPICDTSFTPERKDRIYCSDSCKLTARSRRYRQRKREKN